MRIEIRDKDKTLLAWTACKLRQDQYSFYAPLSKHQYRDMLETALDSINRGEYSGTLDTITFNANYEY